MTNFQDLGLATPILAALEREGYETPTPIQQQAIPFVLGGRDLLGIAQTGTGKTAAFALPILQRLSSDRKPAPRKGCRALILSPTRELASQIAESFKTYGKGLGLSVAVVFGGVGYRPQIAALTRGVDVLVATPGRLLDHMAEGNAMLGATEVLVLDEADQMLDLGFFKPIRQIVSKLPLERQNMFFSATMPKEISALAHDLLRNPAKVAVTPVGSTAERVGQRVIHVESHKKKALLAELLGDAAMSRTLVFTRTKRGADRVSKYLEGAGIRSAAIHGNKSQNQREAALKAFSNSRIRVLVATDIAARGIDIDSVSHVVNFELPEVPEAYVHRIGRTARAGASGSAISLCDASERDLLRGIERLTRKSIPSEDRRNDASLVAEQSEKGGRRSSGRDGSDRSRQNGRADRRGGRDDRSAGAGGARHGEHRATGGRGPDAGRDRRTPAQRHDEAVVEQALARIPFLATPVPARNDGTRAQPQHGRHASQPSHRDEQSRFHGKRRPNRRRNRNGQQRAAMSA